MTHRGRSNGNGSPGVDQRTPGRAAGGAQPAEQCQDDGEIEQDRDVSQASLLQSGAGTRGEQQLCTGRVDRRQVGMVDTLVVRLAQMLQSGVGGRLRVRVDPFPLDATFPDVAIQIVAMQIAEQERNPDEQRHQQYPARARTCTQAEQPDQRTEDEAKGEQAARSRSEGQGHQGDPADAGDHAVFAGRSASHQ